MSELKKTIGVHPLDQYFSTSSVSVSVSEPKPVSNEIITQEPIIPTLNTSFNQSTTGEPIKHTEKQRITLHLQGHLVERIKNAVFFEPGLTISCFAEAAFMDALHKLEKKRGEPYPVRNQRKLKAGRPIK
jgi:hypothetical protein